MTTRSVPADPPRPVVAPPRGSRWPFRLVAYALGVTAFGAGIPTPLYSIYEQQYHFTSAVLASIFGAYTIGVLATMLLVAPLSDTIGRKPVLYVGMVLTASSGLAFIFSSGIATLAVARIISGLAVGATTSTATASMAGLEPRKDQHHVARVSVAANFGGVATGVLLSGFMAQYGPAPTQFVYFLLIGASCVGIVFIGSTSETVLRQSTRTPVRFQRIVVPTEDRRPFWVAAGALAACYSIYGFFGALAPTFLRERLSIGNYAQDAAVVAAMFGLAAIVQLALGQVRDRRALLGGLPLILGAIIVVVWSLRVSSLPLLVVGAAVLGTGVGFAYMGSVTLIDRVAPASLRGEILSAFFVVGYLALAVPTIGIGLAADQVGLESAAVAFGLALGLFVTALYLITLRTPTPPGGEGRRRGTP